MATKKKKAPAQEPKVEAQKVEAKTEGILQEVAEEPVVEPVKEVKKLKLEVYRDEEGRLVIAAEGKPKRIAGTDEAFAEVARQLGAEIVKERLI